MFTLNSKEEVQDIAILPDDIPSYEGTVKLLDSCSNVVYCSWSHEFASRHHLQGVIQFGSDKTSGKTVKDIFGNHVHHDLCKRLNRDDKRSYSKMIDDCISYTQKESTRVCGPYSYGIRLEKGSNKGKKIEACHRSPERIKIEDPDLFRMVFASELTEKFMIEFAPPAWDRIWQNRVNELLVQAPDDRKIIWCYGEKGGEGKSTFAKGLILRGFAYVDANKYADMFEMYHQQGVDKNIVVDFHRSCDVNSFYGFVEKVKNRVIPKIKYRSMICFDPNNIHVVVMSNVEPDYSKISEDRIILIECGFEKMQKIKVPPLKKQKLAEEDEVPPLGKTIYMGCEIDQDNIIRELPNGSWVCHDDGEFEYIMRPGGLMYNQPSSRGRTSVGFAPCRIQKCPGFN